MDKKVMEREIKTDVLVIGSGIAGCFAAIHACQGGAAVTIVEQGEAGFVGRSAPGPNIQRVVLPEDDFDKALEGTVRQCDYMVDQEYADEVIRESEERFQEELALGASVERGWDGKVKWMMMETQFPDFKQREAIWEPFGSYKHLHKYMVEAQRQGAQIISRTVITDLLTKNGAVVGAVGVNRRTGEFLVIHARAVVMATGDCHAAAAGNNPSLTGDGMAIGLRAGAQLRGMEFGRIGFSVIYPAGKPMTMAETMRRGLRMPGQTNVRIVNALGEEFCEQYESTRKIPGRLVGGPPWDCYLPAILKEYKEGRGPVFWDVGAMKFEIGFTAQQSEQNGGIRIDKNGCTSVPGLYAAGNGSDMCGAVNFSIPYNLMGSHATGRRAGIQAAQYAQAAALEEADREQIEGLKEQAYAPLAVKDGVAEAQIRMKLIDIWKYLDWRTEENLTRAYEMLRDLEKEAERLQAEDWHELVKCLKIRNTIQVGQASALAARERRESRLLHYRDDYPLTDNVNWLKWVIVQGVGGDMRVTTEDIPMERYKYRPEPTMVDRLAPARKDG